MAYATAAFSGCGWERVNMHEGDSSNTPSDLHPIVQAVNAVITEYQ